MQSLDILIPDDDAGDAKKRKSAKCNIAKGK